MNEREPGSLLTHFIFSIFIVSHRTEYGCLWALKMSYRNCLRRLPAYLHIQARKKFVGFFEAKNYYFPCHCRQCGREISVVTSMCCSLNYSRQSKMERILCCGVRGKYYMKEVWLTSTWKMHAHRHLNLSQPYPTIAHTHTRTHISKYSKCSLVGMLCE